MRKRKMDRGREGDGEEMQRDALDKGRRERLVSGEVWVQHNG